MRRFHDLVLKNQLVGPRTASRYGVVNPRTLEPEVAKEILEELSDIRDHEVDEMIKQQNIEEWLMPLIIAVPATILAFAFRKMKEQRNVRDRLIPNPFEKNRQKYLRAINKMNLTL